MFQGVRDPGEVLEGAGGFWRVQRESGGSRGNREDPEGIRRMQEEAGGCRRRLEDEGG